MFLDVENVIKSFKCNTYGLKHLYVDFGELRNQLSGGRDIACSIAYSAYDPALGTSPCLRSIEDDGFQLILEERTGFVQKGVDVHMALDMVDFARNNQCDTILLISGDADFVPAVRVLQSMGKRVQVAAFESALSDVLAHIADDVILLDRLDVVDVTRLRKGMMPEGVAA